MTIPRVRPAAFLVAFLLARCANSPPPILPVDGVVRLPGKPLRHAEGRFRPLIGFGPEYIATGVTDDSGHFQLTCKGNPGACAGENRVLVVEGEIPAAYKGENAQAELARYFQ